MESRKWNTDIKAFEEIQRMIKKRTDISQTEIDDLGQSVMRMYCASSILWKQKFPEMVETCVGNPRQQGCNSWYEWLLQEDSENQAAWLEKLYPDETPLNMIWDARKKRERLHIKSFSLNN